MCLFIGFSFVCDAIDGWCARKFNQGMQWLQALKLIEMLNACLLSVCG